MSEDEALKESPTKDKPLPPPPLDEHEPKNNPVSTISPPALYPPPETVVSDYVNVAREISQSGGVADSIPPVIPPRSNLTRDNVENHNSNNGQINLNDWSAQNGSMASGPTSLNGNPALTLEKVVMFVLQLKYNTAGVY